MIEEAHSADFTSLRLPAVEPWVRFPACPKCGSCLGAGIWLLAVWHQARGEAAQKFGYCKGSQNSTVQVPGMQFGHGEAPQFAMANVNVPCFGVFEEHLHLECGRCSFAWLMQVKGGK